MAARLQESNSEGFLHLLSGARRGDAVALGQLLQRYRPYLLRIAGEEIRADLGAKVAPSDVVQQSLLSACRAISQFQGEAEPDLRAWLRKILRNNIANATASLDAEKRDARREVSLDAAGGRGPLADGLTADLPSPSTLASQQELAGRLQEALRSLSEEHRHVLRLRYEEQLGWQEVGAALGRDADAARMLGKRALERLRDRMGGGDER